MVYARGVIVLFIYIVSLSPNKMEKEGKKKIILTLSRALIGSLIWRGGFLPLKEINKFSQPFEKQINTILILVVIILIIASIIPSISMTSFKGLKASS